MTTQSETDNINEINEDNQTITVIQESSINESDKNHEELTTIEDENEQKNSLMHEKNSEENNSINDDTEINSNSITKVNINEEQEQQKEETTVNNHEDDNRSKKLFNSKYKYSSMIYHRSPYYTNGHPYGPAPYYYYHVAPINEKPPPLMVIPTQPPSTATATATTTTTTTTDNQTSNSTTAPSQNLPPRLRQISINENDSNLQQSSSQVSTTTGSQPTTNGRRHRSILPRGSCNYYSPHPPPLMATPPGVLFPYPPTFHQSGHIAYNIRTPDELELLAFQQHVMNIPPPLVWPPPVTYPQYPPYSMYESSSYIYNNSSTMNSNNSSLNPEAAEWVPPSTDPDVSSSDNHILIDDEINFPPLNNNRIEENNSDQHNQVDSSPEIDSINNIEDKTTIPPSKIDTTITNSSSSQDDNKNLSSSSSKSTIISYSNVILQTLDMNKSNKTNNQNQRRQQPSINNIQVQLPPRDRTIKQQKSQIPIPKDNSSRRRQPTSNRNNFNGIRHSISTETPKQTQQQQQQQLADDWIEVKSKKTKKFDRSISDIQYENSTIISQKSLSDQQITKTLSPPSSLSSTSDNTVGTCTSEEEDDKDDVNNISDNKLVMIVENKTIPTTTTTTEDYNQIIIDDIHRRLDNGERLLIIMRGCPGSGKSTLAKSLNEGYNGQILSADEYFKDNNSNEYRFDPTKLETVHLYNRRLVSDAFKQNISPIIIDNTNTTSSEMKPYATMGKEAGYEILLVEPQTPWRYKARELVKRNLHNIPLRRIKEMLNNFEHNVNVENIIDQTKINLFIPCQPQQILEQHGTDNESIDPILTSKKSFNIINDSDILNDVRLCINDMILFLTSNFYQTSQSLTSLTISFSDLSLIPSSSSPTTPTTPHSLFHRSLSRFSSTTTSQDHSFTNEHLLRLPTTAFSRCIEKLTPPSSTNSSIIGKKRRKNKNKQQQHSSNEILLNTNNNNNNNNNQIINENDYPLQQLTYNVILAEDYSDFIIIDEQNDNHYCDSFIQNFDQRRNSYRNHSSINTHQQKSDNNKKNELINIIHDELTKPSVIIDQYPSKSFNHIAIQCSSNDFNQEINSSYRILIGHLSAQSPISPSIPIRPGYIECGTQVDLNENNIQSLSHLIELYSDRLSSKIIKQFYDLCNSDIQWTRIQIDEYLKHNNNNNNNNNDISIIPTLRQLSFNVLNQWNEQLKDSNPSYDTISIGDLLQDISDEDVFEELILDNELNNNSIEFKDSNQMTIPWSIVNSLQELYGELPIQSTSSDITNGLSLPLDDDLSMNIYQALQRFLGIPNKINKPVNEKKLTKENKKLNKQRWNLPPQNESNINSNKKTNGPSLKEIINEELNYINRQKSVQKRQLDFASQLKLKELERIFPNFSADILYDIFCENESDYDLTLVCVSSMLDENTPINVTSKSQSSSSSNIRSSITTKSIAEPAIESYEILRRDAHFHALKRKDCYNKADQANCHGMIGVASYYINQAREQTRLMKDANRIACECLSKTRLIQFHQTHRLDLHELYADEALHLFKQVEQELNEGNKRTTPKSIEIITGYGKNSLYGGGCGKIRSIILTYIRQKNYKYSEPNKGTILVQF
ncbi:unnamed protein product [Rotaria sordida]|uniref:Smr domain-containing protein n=2 Tax=Rotaria sordida TaxID=392033 RepID=A0A813VWL9_9BILA|nr:unnamed protein product [Rotaria sordida]